MMNLKEMTSEQLQKLLTDIKKELNRRQNKELVLYTHDCKDASSYHLRKYKHWAKLITSVDTTKTNGYAFGGEFLSVTAEHKLPTGSLIVEVCSCTATLYRLTTEGKEEICEAKTNAMSSLIERAAQEL